MEMINKFSEAYLNYQVVFTDDNFDPNKLKSDLDSRLHEEFSEILDDDKPENAWGFRNAQNNLIIGYTPPDVEETQGGIIVMGRVHSEFESTEHVDIKAVQDVIEMIMKSPALRSAAVNNTITEITLYYNPFGEDKASEYLSKLASKLLPQRELSEEVAFNVFNLSYRTAYGVYTKKSEYTYATNKMTKGEAISVEVTIQRDTKERTSTDALRDLLGVDVGHEISSEAEYLETQRQSI